LHKDNCDETAMSLSLLPVKKVPSKNPEALKDSGEVLYS